MSSTASWRCEAIPELCGPLPAVALALLAVNDHVLKAAWPGVVTGKLSDLAGCFFLPLLVSGVLGLATRWPRTLRLGVGAAATTVLFAAIKLSPAAADAIAAALGWILGWTGLGPSRIVADPTDLLALPLVALAVAHGQHAGRRSELGPPLAAQLPTFGTVHWKAGERIDFYGDGPIPGASVPDGWETTTRCQLRSRRGLDLLEAECLTWVHSSDWKKQREVRSCSGTLRRVRGP